MNDAPAQLDSDLGVAIGAGADVAIEAADIVLVSNNPEDVAAILGLSRKTYGKIKHLIPPDRCKLRLQVR